MGGDPARREPGALALRPRRKGVTSRLRKAPRYARLRASRALNRVADAVETRTADGGPRPLAYPLLLVVGAPRSGSTLAYQALVAAFEVGYLSNAHCRLYGAPSLIERVWRPEPPPAFDSRFGRTAGVAAPSECGEFWYRFFRRRPQYVPLAEVPPPQLRRLRAAVRALGDAAGRPLVFKNLLCTLRVAPIAAALPEALFVVVRRDLAANAASLLAARRAVVGDVARWWSAEPPEVDDLRALPAPAQVVEQVRRIEALVDRDRADVGPDRFHELTYERLCEDAEGAMADVARFAAGHGVELRRRRPIPAKFERPAATPLEPELHARIVEYVNR